MRLDIATLQVVVIISLVLALVQEILQVAIIISLVISLDVVVQPGLIIISLVLVRDVIILQIIMTSLAMRQVVKTHQVVKMSLLVMQQEVRMI